MANVEIFSDEFFGFAVPDLPPIPDDNMYSDNAANSFPVNDTISTSSGTEDTPRPTNEPVEHEMIEEYEDCDNDNSDPERGDVDNRYPVNNDTGDASMVNDNNGCECESFEDENDEIIKTTIEFQLTKSHKENGGFSLTSSSAYGHTIDIDDTENSHVQHMRLQNGDSIIGIKNIDVRSYEHHILVSTLQHIYGEDSGDFTMVIGRRFETDERNRSEVRYIQINVRFEFPARGETILRMSADVVTFSSVSFTKIICVEFRDSKACWLRNNGRYISVKDNALSVDESLPSKSNKNFQFQWFTFHGLEARTHSNTMLPAVFFCAFQSPVTNTFITVQSENRVGLGGTSTLRRNITAIRKPDCRFFKVRLVSDNSYLLESLVYEGVYLCNGRGGLAMRKRTSNFNDPFRIPRQLKFEIITSDGNALM
ncbi:uncharacterized protein [Argopecten irradians]|uniref:uncharacterized protein isoform X1 n=1 Tax=Argopecten irradians TaxID=31199 RepID=UPI003710BBDC